MKQQHFVDHDAGHPGTSKLCMYYKGFGRPPEARKSSFPWILWKFRNFYIFLIAGPQKSQNIAGFISILRTRHAGRPDCKKFRNFIKFENSFDPDAGHPEASKLCMYYKGFRQPPEARKSSFARISWKFYFLQKNQDLLIAAPQKYQNTAGFISILRAGHAGRPDFKKFMKFHKIPIFCWSGCRPPRNL